MKPNSSDGCNGGSDLIDSKVLIQNCRSLGCFYSKLRDAWGKQGKEPRGNGERIRFRKSSSYTKENQEWEMREGQ